MSPPRNRAGREGAARTRLVHVSFPTPEAEEVFNRYMARGLYGRPCPNDPQGRWEVPHRAWSCFEDAVSLLGATWR